MNLLGIEIPDTPLEVDFDAPREFSPYACVSMPGDRTMQFFVMFSFDRKGRTDLQPLAEPQVIWVHPKVVGISRIKVPSDCRCDGAYRVNLDSLPDVWKDRVNGNAPNVCECFGRIIE